jgi:hypothetical protein
MNVQVAVLADTPVEENQDVIQATATLIRAAKADQLVAIVCHHQESKEPVTVICVMSPAPDSPGNVVSAPIAMLFTEGNTPWLDYELPKAALPQPGPLEGLEESNDERSNDSESASCETTEGLGEDPSN